MPNPTRLVAARLRDETQPSFVAAGPTQRLGVTHSREPVDLDQRATAALDVLTIAGGIGSLAQHRFAFRAHVGGERDKRTAGGAALHRGTAFIDLASE